MSDTPERPDRWRALRVERLVDAKGWPVRGELDEILHATRDMAAQIGLRPRAFTLFPTVNNKKRVTFAMPSADLIARTRQHRAPTSVPSIYEREGWPEDWPEDVDRASLASARIGFGPDWQPAPSAALLDFELDDEDSREVLASAAEAFELDPVGWILTPVNDMAASRTIACPRLHVAREAFGKTIRQVFETAAMRNPSGAPPGWLDELLILQRPGHPGSWPDCKTAWHACEPYAGPIPAHLLS